MQRSRYTHIAKQVFPYSQESTTGSPPQCVQPYLSLVVQHIYHTYLGTDLVQITDVFNAQPSFPMTLDCHTDGKFTRWWKIRHSIGHRSF